MVRTSSSMATVRLSLALLLNKQGVRAGEPDECGRHATRCSGSLSPLGRGGCGARGGSRAARRSAGTSWGAGGGRGSARERHGMGEEQPSRAGTVAPRIPGGSAAAVASVTTIWPAPAAASARQTAVAAGPTTISSRCTAGSPARTRWTGPLWMPLEARSTTRPTDVRRCPTRPSTRCMPRAARAARSGCPKPSSSSSTASPPHFSRSAPSTSAMSTSGVNTACRTSLSSSAPARPCCESRSVRRVNPEMSNITRLASSSRCARPSLVVAHPGSSRGR